MSGTLYVCATPIGNLGDAPPRLAAVLGEADLVYAEDTRRTAVLLRHLGVDVPVRSYFVGNEENRSRELEQRLADGATVALVTDAGTPAISDPGVSAVRAAVAAGATVTVVPGPSAVTAALAASGFGSDRFVFEGFLPRSGAVRTGRLDELAREERTIVVFSATRRVADDLEALGDALGADRPVVVARELTKAHEEVWRGTLGEATEHWRETEPRGEFTIVVAPRERAAPSIDDALTAVGREMESGASLSAAVRRVASGMGISRRRLYEAALQRERGDVTER